jgi:glyoxylase-like metal-dependent hydrolase (beta-lactamase superfamily II)
VYDETNTCVIVDPGMYHEAEENALQDFITAKNLTPVLLLNTHCHIDHIFGNKFVKDTYNISFHAHQLEMDNLNNGPQHARIFGVSMGPSPQPNAFIEPGKDITFGNTTFSVLFTPGHSAGSVSFYNAENSFVLAGDALFMGSIGRTDLPGGDYETLIKSIKTQLLTLPDATIVYSGHGPETTVVRERNTNPFLV